MPRRVDAGPILLSLAHGVPMALFNPPAAHLWLHKAPVRAKRFGRSRRGTGEDEVGGRAHGLQAVLGPV